MNLPAGRPKILFFVTALEDRGTENAALRLALGLESAGGYASEILALKEGSGRLKARAAAAGYDRVSSLGLSSPLSLGGAVAALRRKLARERVAVLYACLFHPNIVSRLAVRGAGDCLLINSERSVPGGRWAFRSVARRWTAGIPDGYTAVSDAVREGMVRVLGVPGDRVRTIRSGVDAGDFLDVRVPPAGPGGPHLLSIGALAPEKAYGTLVSALGRLPGNGATLTILGEGPQRRALEERARSYGLSGRVRLPGHAADIAPFLRDADVYVQSSDREGLSNALLRAMAAGLPCVATDVGGTREAVSDGETGILVPPGDPGAMAAGILRLVGRPRDAGLMGRKAREKAAREFTAERETAETLDWIDELLRRRSEGRSPATSRT